MIPAFKSILVPTDFSSTSEHALEYGVEMARRLGASIRLLHVISNPVEVAAFPEGYWIELSGLRERLREDAERQIAALAASIKGVDVKTKVLDGTPARTVVQMAKDWGCQLIVMGTHGHGRVAQLLLGSVAERVVRTAPCPVLTVSAASAEAEASKTASATE